MTVRHEVKGQLAKLLATEDLIVESKKVETACFNVHTRVLTLDTFGTDDFLKIIRFIIKDANTFVISHKIDMQDKFENVLKFDKVKGFSQIVT